MDVLPALAKLALGTAEGGGERRAVLKAMDLIQRRTGALDVFLFYGESGRMDACALGSDQPFSDQSLMYLQQRLVQIRVPLVFDLSGSEVEFITRASNKQRRDYIAWLIPSAESWTEMLVLRGAWSGSAAVPLLDFIDSAMPALSMILERHLGAGRKERLAQQLSSITDSVGTLREMVEVVGSVAAVVPTARNLPPEQAQLLQTMADRASLVLDEVRTHRDLIETHLRLQQYTLDYTMRLEHAVEAERRNATTDALTGLINHRGALALLQTASEAAAADDRTLSLLMVDVDGFKLFNDTYGHVTGDAVLKLVASTLQASIEDRGPVCRYGGDEFLVILPGFGKAEATAAAVDITERLARSEFQSEGYSVPVGVSIGVANFPEDSLSTSKLLAHADAAMYAAKRRTRTSGSIIVANTDDTSFGVLDSLVQAIDAKDKYTKAHCDIVAEYAVKLADRMGLPEETRRALRTAGLLHDVGKLVVPDEILKKPAPLTIEEYEVMRRHVNVGEVLIREVPQLNEVIQAVACHHERFDGSGYPRGLAGEEIPLIGRVIALADSYSAMRLDRPYRKGMGHDRVLNELVAGAGRQFDPDILKIFVELLLEEELLRGSSSSNRRVA